VAMSPPTDRFGLSPKRQQLCSRENALRVAGRIFDNHPKRISILNTGDPLQPFRISIDPANRDQIVAEMVA